MGFYREAFTMILIIAGMLLIMLEVVVPGFGLPGISGIILLGLGILAVTDSLILSAIYLIIGLLVSILLGVILASWLKRSGRLDNIVLDSKLDREAGYIPGEAMDKYLNKEGRARTNLRPSGFIEIEGQRLDAITSGEYISKDEKVVVYKIEGSKILVRRV